MRQSSVAEKALMVSKDIAFTDDLWAEVQTLRKELKDTDDQVYSMQREALITQQATINLHNDHNACRAELLKLGEELEVSKQRIHALEHRNARTRRTDEEG